MANTVQNNKQGKKGKGWFGDSEGHARAGSKGGKSRGRNRQSNMNTISQAS